jgi:2-dehydropantoate 2-reductase
MEQLIADFNQAGVKAYEVEYHEARWKKAVWNMPFNGMTVALNTQTDQLLAHPATRELIHCQMLEVIGAAHALGVKNIDASFADRMIEMTLNMTPYSPSMKLDYDFHRPMEIEYLYSHAIAEAHSVGYSMPCLEMLEAELKFLDVTNKK